MSLDFLFSSLSEQERRSQSQLEWSIHISFYQIYQENIQDMFNPENKNLTIREENGEVFVEDLVEVPVKSFS